MTQSELIDLIIAKAPALRAAGVVGAIELSDSFVRFQLAEPVPVLPAQPQAERKEPADPLQDGATFGIEGRAPGFDLSEIDHE